MTFLRLMILMLKKKVMPFFQSVFCILLLNTIYIIRNVYH